MGGSGRGDRLEIGTCVENSIDSELSGQYHRHVPGWRPDQQAFPLCGPGLGIGGEAIVAAHDAVGSCLYHHVRRGEILRTVPRDNEATNETWLSDRDRFSHLGPLFRRPCAFAPGEGRRGMENGFLG